MDRKTHEMLEKFIEEKDPKNDKEFNEVIEEFMQKYSEGLLEETPKTKLDEAYELLEKAENAKTEKQAKKLAKQAYDTCSECFDAIIFLSTLEESASKTIKILDEGLEHEKQRLTKEGFFDKDNIGIFYGIYETRPYMRGLHMKAITHAQEGKMTLAKETCKEMLRLNKNDNIGARYLLMAIYAYLEDEKSLLKLHQQYNEESFAMLFPLMIYYYKQNNYEKASFYLNKVKKVNKNIIKFFDETLELDDDAPDGYYQRGGASEIFMYYTIYSFLVESVPEIDDFVLKK